MAITVNNSASSLNNLRNLNKATSDLNKANERLASGKRNNRPSDDTAGAAVARQLLVDAEVNAVAARNVSDGVSIAMIPAIDNSGPGCGWDFAGTINPVTTEAELAAGAREAVITALVKDTQAQGQRMVNMLNWPNQHQAWVAKASIAKSWDDYRTELELAKDRLSKAKQKYQDSVDEWRQGTLLPEPTTSPPSESPVPDPSQVTPGGTQ